MTANPTLPSSASQPLFRHYSEVAALVARGWYELGWNAIPYFGRRKAPVPAFTRDFRSRPYEWGGPANPTERVARELSPTLTNSRRPDRAGRAWADPNQIRPDLFRWTRDGDEDGGVYLYTASGPPGQPTLLVFDLDFRVEGRRGAWSTDALRAWFLQQLPDTPLALARNGRLKHLYYRIPEPEEIRFVHRVGLLGRGTVDAIASTGVAAAGTPHRDGGINEYVAWVDGEIRPTPWPQRAGVPDTTDAIPLLPGDFLETLMERALQLHEQGVWRVDWADEDLHRTTRTRTPRTRQESDSPSERTRIRDILRSPRAFEHAGEIVLPDDDMPVRLANGAEAMLSQVPSGTKIHIPASLRGGREDRSPSGSIYTDRNGSTRLYDWSTQRSWLILSDQHLSDPTVRPAGAEEEVEPFGSPSFRLVENQWSTSITGEVSSDVLEGVLAAEGLSYTPSIVFHTLQEEQYVTDVLDLDVENLPDVLVIVAPHGLGKTTAARRICDQHERVVSVTCHRSLVASNARVLGLQEVLTKAKKRGSVTLASIDRYADEEAPDLLHLDEFTKTLEFAASPHFRRKEQNKTFDTFVRLFAEAKRVVITDADISPAYVQLIAKMVKRYRPNSRFAIHHVSRAVPEERRKKVTITSMADVKARIHRDILAGRKVIIATGSRRLPHAIVNAYTSPRVRVFSDVAAYESPVSVTPGSSRSGFCVTGENSKLKEMHDYIDGDYNAIVRDHDVFVYSPAIQSGVSITEEVDAVYMIGDNIKLDAETMLQMIMRARNVRTLEYVVGLPDKKPSTAHEDMVKLDPDYHHRQIEQAYKHRQREGEVIGANEDDEDVTDTPEWLDLLFDVYVNQRIRHQMTWISPIHRLEQVARVNGYEVEILHYHTPDRQLSRQFDERVKVAREQMEAARVHAVVGAEDIDKEERERLSRSHDIHPGDAAKMERYDIRQFYGLRTVTEQAVLVDDRGRFRDKCRYFGAVYMLAQASSLEDENVCAVAFSSYHDGMRPVFSKHLFTKAMVLADFVRNVVGLELSARNLSTTFDMNEVRARLIPWWNDWGGLLHSLFPRIRRRLPETLHGQAKLVNAILRRLGANVRRPEGQRHGSTYSLDFTRPYEWSSAFRGQLRRRYEEGDPAQVRKFVERLVRSIERRRQRLRAPVSVSSPPA